MRYEVARFQNQHSKPWCTAVLSRALHAISNEAINSIRIDLTRPRIYAVTRLLCRRHARNLNCKKKHLSGGSVVAMAELELKTTFKQWTRTFIGSLPISEISIFEMNIKCRVSHRVTCTLSNLHFCLRSIYERVRSELSISLFLLLSPIPMNAVPKPKHWAYRDHSTKYFQQIERLWFRLARVPTAHTNQLPDYRYAMDWDSSN